MTVSHTQPPLVIFDAQQTPTPRWWTLTWFLWAAFVAGAVLLCDRDGYSACGWLAVGVIVGTCGWRLVGFFSPAVFAWHERFSSDPEIDARLAQLEHNDRFVNDGFLSAEYEELLIANSLPTFFPPLAGFLVGIPLGSLGGTLCALDPTVTTTASLGAIYGMLFGAVGISTIAAVSLAYFGSPNSALSRNFQFRARMKVLFSPFTVFPVSCLCVKYLIARSKRTVASAA
ncbi:MAG: hypothetical protein AB8G99_23550 [Planctomycetaceae bacterium]